MGKHIITINRMHGSNGRRIGQALAETLGIKFYDRELIRLASEQKGIPYDELAKVDEKRASKWRYPVESDIQMQPQYRFHPMNDVLFEAESEIIRGLVNEDCVIVGRCANRILGDKALSVFIYAPAEFRIRTVMERSDRTEKSARSMIKKLDKERRYYYEYFTDENWLDMGQYDLCIDSSKFTQNQIIQMLTALYHAE